MKKIPIHFVIATSKSQSEMNDLPIVKSIVKLNNICGKYQIHTHIEFDNKRGLSEIYNKALHSEEIINLSDDGFIIFTHDDVEIRDNSVFDTLIKGKEHYGFDVMGVAGANKITIPLNGDEVVSWYNSSVPKDRHGIVMHNHDNEIFFSNYGQKTNIPVCCIDGLFIAMNYSASRVLRFDEEFMFHHYDLDLCLSATRKHSLSIGVVPIVLLHYSIGEGVNSNEYTEAQNKLKDKWVNTSI